LGFDGPCKFLRNNIHDNESYAIFTDETINVEIGGNHIYNNGKGIFPFLRQGWSSDLNYWPHDNVNIHDNLIERNEGEGIDFIQSYSQLKNNIIKYTVSNAIMQVSVTQLSGTFTYLTQMIQLSQTLH